MWMNPDEVSSSLTGSASGRGSGMGTVHGTILYMYVGVDMVDYMLLSRCSETGDLVAVGIRKVVAEK